MKSLIFVLLFVLGCSPVLVSGDKVHKKYLDKDMYVLCTHVQEWKVESDLYGYVPGSRGCWCQFPQTMLPRFGPIVAFQLVPDDVCRSDAP